MSESTSDSLPPINRYDLLSSELEEVFDPEYKRNWHNLIDTNPEFAEWIMERAHELAQKETGERKKMVTMAMFVLEAIRAASKRKGGIPNASVDGEGSQPSDE